MNITYLIGNGFDIGLGLKTGYDDFISWYMSSPATNPVEEWLKKRISGERKAWSDAELAFGALPFDDLNCNPLKVYDQSYELFTSAFHKYLVSKNGRLVVSPDQQEGIASWFLKSILRLNKYMTEGGAEYYKKLLEKQPISIRFVTFNYTDSLEKILGVGATREKEFHLEFSQGQKLKVLFQGVFHAHGTLNANFVFGVDEPVQIANEEVRSSCERKGGILKGRSAEKIGLVDRKRAMNVVRSSDMIVTYGLSFGETDHSWWSALYQVFMSRSIPIVVCPYSEVQTIGLSARQHGEIFDQEKKRLFATLIRRNPKLSDNIETIDVPRIIVLDPQKVSDGLGTMSNCDFFRLKYISRKCVKDSISIESNDRVARANRC